MVLTKHEHVIKQGFCKMLCRKLCLQGSLLLVLFNFWRWEGQRGWGGGDHLFELEWKWEGEALINVFCLQDGRLFEVVTNSNKYGSQMQDCLNEGQVPRPNCISDQRTG